MNSFFDVFKWDRFVAPSAMELLFWLVSAIAVLFGVWGLSSGIAMVETAPVPGLVLISVSIIGTLAGIVAARIACEAVVILFRVNENLMDIAERGFTAMPAPIVESAAVRLEHRAPEPREEPLPARRQPERSATIIEDLPPVFDAEEEEEDDAADPFAPDQGRVEPRAWDVKPVQPKSASTDVAASEPHQRMRDVTPASARDRSTPPEARARVERAAEARSDRRDPDGREPEARAAETRVSSSRSAGSANEVRGETRAERSPPAVVEHDTPAQQEREKREASRRRAASDEPAIEHALKRLSQPASANPPSDPAPSRERRMPAARVEDGDFISSAAPDPVRRETRRPGGATPEAVPLDSARAGQQKPAAPRRRPVADEEATPLPAFLANRAEPEAPIDLPPVLSRQDAASREDSAEPKAAPRMVREKTVQVAARETAPERQPEPRRDEASRSQKPKGGQAPLKRRRPRRDRDGA